MQRLGRLVGAAGLVGVSGVVCAGLIVGLALQVPPALPAPAQGFELGRVTLVEPGGRRSGPVRLRGEGGLIDEISAAGPGAPGAATDTFVLPGLTDMHAHLPTPGLPGDDEYTALLFLLHGVTTVRIAGGTPPRELDALRERIAEGGMPGPRFFGCGDWLDGPDPVLPGARVVNSPEEGREAVLELADAGAHCIKAYDHLDEATLSALRETAHARGLPLIGHTPQSVAFEHARIDDVQHLRGVHPPFQDERLDYPYFLEAWLRLDDAWIEHVVRTSLRDRVSHTPTLVAVEGPVVSSDWERWRATPTMQLWIPHLRDGVFSGEVGFSPGRFVSAETVEMVDQATRRMARTVKALHAAGVPIHTGSDANAPNVVPGASLHREISLLVAAGLSDAEALAASTRVSQDFLGREDAGRLLPGAPADLAVFREDPTRDVAALDTLVAVVADGRLYTRSDLEERLDRYRDHYDGFAYRRLLMPLLRGALATLTAWL